MTNTKTFKGDQEILVDRLVAVSQERVAMPQLPGFGRELVPYFVPDSENWDESDLNHNLDQEGSRPSGKSSSKKAASRSPERIDLTHLAAGASNAERSGKKKGKMSSSPPMPSFFVDAALAEKTDASRKPSKGSAPSGSTSKKEPASNRFAGPAFATSPGPESLPMPTFLLGGMATPEAPAAAPDSSSDLRRLLQIEPAPARPCIPTEVDATNSLRSLLQLNSSIMC